MFSGGFWIPIITGVGINAIVATGVYVTLLAGQSSVGHAALMGIGAYIAAVLTTKLGMPFPVAVLAAIAAAAAIGALLSVVTMRMSELAVGLTTIAFGETAVVVAFNIDYIGGAQSFGGIPLVTTTWLVYLALAAVIFVTWRLDHSRLGLGARAVRDDRMAAAAMGVDVPHLRVLTFALGAAFAGLGGALNAHYFLVITPSDLSFFQSFIFKMFVLFGGSYTFVGPTIGAAILTTLPEVFRFLFDLSSVLSQSFRLMAYGVVVVLIIVLRPKGLLVRRPTSVPARRGDASASGAVSIPAASWAAAGGLRGAPATATTAVGTPALRVEGLSKRFGGLKAVSDLSFEVAEGRITSLIGPNGSGKTTAFNLISGVLRPDAGQIELFGRSTAGWGSGRIAAGGLSRTFQHVQLFTNLNALENVIVGRYCRTRSGLVDTVLGLPGYRAERKRLLEDAGALLERVGLAEHGHKMPGEMSYGMQRRLEIARALATEPRLLILDEPTSGVHGQAVHELVDLVEKLVASGLTVLLIEHNMNIVMGLSDRVVVMNFGQKIADGRPDEVRADARVIEAYLGSDA